MAKGKRIIYQRKFKIKRSKEDYNKAKENNKKVVFLDCRNHINFPDHTEAEKKKDWMSISIWKLTWKEDENDGKREKWQQYILKDLFQ